MIGFLKAYTAALLDEASANQFVSDDGDHNVPMRRRNGTVNDHGSPERCQLRIASPATRMRNVAADGIVSGMHAQCNDRKCSVYIADSKALAAFFESMSPAQVAPHHVAEFLKLGRKMKRKVRANRERAALSSFFTWLLTYDHADVTFNPCSGIKRNTETKRERYVTHDEYREVWEVATRSERLLMGITYRTLQRPESDIILWTTANLVSDGEKRALLFRQNKTGRPHRIARRQQPRHPRDLAGQGALGAGRRHGRGVRTFDVDQRRWPIRA